MLVRVLPRRLFRASTISLLKGFPSPSRGDLFEETMPEPNDGAASQSAILIFAQ